jgi:hypothetical protein
MVSQEVSVPHYRIEIRGQLPADIRLRFEGWAAADVEGGNTLIAGQAVDQSALHGILDWLRDLNLPLLSVNQVEPGEKRKRKSTCDLPL